MAHIEEGLPDGAEFDRLATERTRLREERRRLQDEIAAVRAYEQDEHGFAREAKN